jgi:hypothetical protein
MITAKQVESAEVCDIDVLQWRFITTEYSLLYLAQLIYK